jgi:membrane protein YqaA with SNARE-associated domain
LPPLTFGPFDTPLLALAVALALGLVFGAIPIGGAELVAVAAGALEPRSIVAPVVLLFTAGHVAGKVIWYWPGTQAERVRHPRVRAWIARAKELTRSHPRITASLLGASALVSVPPFHVMAIASGMVRFPLLRFVAIGFAGRLVRFALIAALPSLARLVW